MLPLAEVILPATEDNIGATPVSRKVRQYRGGMTQILCGASMLQGVTGTAIRLIRAHR
jgi:hypothetical protein